MRRHAKASHAGSTMRQAKGLGRIFRGEVLTRGGSGDAEGSGAPSHRLPLAALAVLALCALFAASAPTAFGAEATELVRSFGPDGTEGSDFQFVGSIATDKQTGDVYVLDFQADTLYKFEADGTPLDWGGSGPDISGNALSGLSAGVNSQVAVDSTSHVVYVAGETALQAFGQNGEAAEFTAGPGSGTNEIAGFGPLVGLAVDANGAIYVNYYTYPESSSTVRVYAPSGESLTNAVVPGEQLGNVAVAADGSLYVSQSGPLNSRIDEFIPSEFPVTSATTYAAGKTLLTADFTSATSLDVDSASGELYVLERYTSNWIAKYDSSGTFLEYFGRAEDGTGRFPVNAHGLAVVPGGAEFQFYVGNNGGATNKVQIFGEIINPGAPSVASTSARDVASTSATLRAEVNPNTFATAYSFEYGLEDCATPTSSCTSIPLNPAAIGSGHRPVVVSQEVLGLQPGTTYHYRVVATNSEGETEGPDRTIATQVSGLGFQLPDLRAWEMVSPPNKHGGSLVQKTHGTIQAAADGSGIAYLSDGSIEARPEGNRLIETSSVLSRRGSDGWHSKDLTAPHAEAASIKGNPVEQLVFAPDLSLSLMEATDNTVLSPMTSGRTYNLRQNTEPATYTPLMTTKEGYANVLPGTTFTTPGGNPNFALRGANPQLTDVAFISRAQLLEGVPSGPNWNLYRWHAGQVHFVGEGVLGSDRGSVRGAISADGSRVFWQTGSYGTAGTSLTALYLNDTQSDEDIRLDTPQPGASGAGEESPAFQGASADGSVVYFTDSQQLTAGASAGGRDLYRCAIPAGAASSGCATLTNLTGPLAGPGESARVLDMSPALSEDGSRIYFVAEGALEGEANEEGDSAVSGEPNLYLFEAGEGVRFIATFSPQDDANWGARNHPGYNGGIAATASPSGRYLAFMSQRSLTGYDNRDEASDEATEQAFRYDAQSGELACISCNPTGASPRSRHMDSSRKKVDRQFFWSGQWVGATLAESSNLDGEAEQIYRPRSVLDDGRVFFNAADGLVPADSNGQWDVYQYEPTGTGDCSASSNGPSISRSGEGCVSLLSSGTSEKEAAFLDASESGEDVFFLSAAKLNETDIDSEYDVYDARVDGVPAKLTPRIECQGEACLAAPQAPNDPTPASASFEGTGNVVSQRCAKGKKLKVRNDGSFGCVAHKKHKKRHAHKAKRAAKSRRAGR